MASKFEVFGALNILKHMSGNFCTSLHTTIVPKTAWMPSKKLSPIIITVDPPQVHPSDGFKALIVGTK